MTPTLDLAAGKDERARLSGRFAFTRAGCPASGDVAWVGQKWLTRSQPFRLTKGRNPLAVHADWRGPVKLVSRGLRWRKVSEVYLARTAFADEVLDPQAADNLSALVEELIDGPMSGDVCLPDGKWKTPDAHSLVRWLGNAGYTAAVDEQHNVRVTLKSRGCDGQVRIACAATQIRMTQQLGCWQQLEPVAKQAITQLACQANARCRLARIAWIEDDDKGQRCEAQVDLSGLPTGDLRDEFWCDMLRMAVGSLELMLRQLGMELEVLADVKNREVAERLIARTRQRSRKPR